MKILFLVPYPTEGASNRVRVEQFIPHLESRGFVCRIRPFMNRRFFSILYLPHHFTEKAFWFAISTLNRILDIARAAVYDLIFIHREAYPFGGPIIERVLRVMGKPIIFDFDDAIFLPNTSEHNSYIERFKNVGKVAMIIELSSQVIVGNSYLKDYSLQYNKNVHVVPSSVDTERYKPAKEISKKDNVVIGWIGSNTTRRFLYDLEDVFVELSRKYPHVTFKIVGAPFYSAKLDNVVNKKWSLEDEIVDLQSFDIGIMPMPNNKWTKGKCGFKTLLYMACGIPAVVSPVGANLDIVDDKINGFFARDSEEWLGRISLLVEDRKLRQEMGSRGREKAVKVFSLNVAVPVFIRTLDEACKFRTK